MPSQSQSLVLIERLFTSLNQRDISYCHWKSNDAIARSLTGENDLDLLIDRRNGQAFNQLLHELGFKRTITSFPRQFPGIEDFYGFDEESGKLVHAHVHYQLVVGEIYLKSVHVPLEQDILNSVVKEDSIVISAPEYELFLFVLRMILRIRLIDVLRGRIYRLKAKEELTYLRTHANLDQLQKILHRYHIPEHLFADLSNSLETKISGWRLLWLQYKLRRALKPFWRMGKIAKFSTLTTRRFFIRANLFRYGQAPKKKLYSGGFSIALVGSDGSGKSTLVQTLKEWLSVVYGIHTFHMGKPKPSLPTLLINKTIGLASRLGIMQRGAINDVNFPVSNTRKRVSLIFTLLQDFCVAKDRYQTFIAIQRIVGQGNIAIIDRYPLPEIKEMDSPFTKKHADQIPSNLAWLAKRIDTYYEAILPPELLIVLQVSPEVAVRRQPGDNPDYVTRRAQEVQQATYTDVNNIFLLNTERPLDEVIRELKTTVWGWL